MSETPRIPPSFPEAIHPTQPAGPARKVDASGPARPAFEALFERLTSRAAELEEKSRTLAEPGELPDAVDAARASLEDALSLGEGLLEAFRASQHAPEEES